MEAGEEGSGLRGWSQEAELGPRGGVIKLLQGSGCRELGAELVAGGRGRRRSSEACLAPIHP